jgi:formylglycine-generating enzyme required for sulfatase activity
MVGDAWWKISESLEGTAKSQTQAHAGDWYRQALPELSGLTAARVEMRLAKLGDAAPSFVNTLGMKLVWIPAGRFTMGSPASEKGRQADENQVQVEISRGFYLGKYEVTQGEWKAIMGTEPWKGQHLKEGADYAATYVSSNDAVEYCKKLSAKEGKEYRLPWEAEWEYACRAGTMTMYSFGLDASQSNDYAWFAENARAVGEQFAHRVGQKKSNSFAGQSSVRPL